MVKDNSRPTKSTVFDGLGTLIFSLFDRAQAETKSVVVELGPEDDLAAAILKILPPVPGFENLTDLQKRLPYDFDAQTEQFKIDYELAQKANDKQAMQKAADIYLIDSAKAGNTQGIKTALAAGANANVTELKDGTRNHQNEGATPLMLVSYLGPDQLENIDILLAANADAKAVMQNGNTVLMSAAAGAARYGNYEKDAAPVIDRLVTAGAEVNEQCKNGATAIFCTINQYDGRISESAMNALLRHHADPNIAVDCGRNLKTDLLSTAKHVYGTGAAIITSLEVAGAVEVSKQHGLT